jgi:hypothetical protein
MRLVWSHKLPGCPLGMGLAREKGLVLAWDAKHWLTLLNRAGQRQSQAPAPRPLAVACCSDDGSAFVACGQSGEVWWLAPDLKPRWERSVRHQVSAAALDPFGHYLAIADSSSHLRVFDRTGRVLANLQTPRPLCHLAFVPEAPLFVGAADFGLVACFDLSGQEQWHIGLVAHCGSLAVSGDGSSIVLACFSEGLRRYDLKGHCHGRLAGDEAYRRASVSYDGRRLLTADATHQLAVRDSYSTLATTPLECPIAALSLAALGERAFVALENGQVTAFDLTAG